MNRGRELLKEKFILPYLKKSEEYIGVELEYPLILADDTVDSKKVVLSLFEYLKKNYGFYDDKMGKDGCLVRVKNNEGDGIGADYRYEIIEFAMQMDLNLNSIADRFYKYFKIVQEFLIKNGCFLTGMGTNLTSSATRVHHTMDPYCFGLNEYIKKYTSYKNPKYFLTNMQSIQTHIDIPIKNKKEGEQIFINALNLFNMLDFVRGILFSNSLPNATSAPPNLDYPKETLCARDFNWLHTELPDTGCVDEKFKTIDELLDYILSLKVYLRKCGDNYKDFKEVSIEEYFSDPQQIDDIFSIFRYFKNVVLNRYAALEVRSDCIQPLKDTFAPTAFNLGISRRVNEATELTLKFFKDNKITYTNSTLRAMAINDKKIVDDKIMQEYLQKLYNLAKAALIERGFGEEKHLYCLQKRIKTLQCPAKFQKQQFLKGVSLDEIVKQCSEL